MNIRIIPRLDIKGPNLVKGVNFEGLRVLGKPQVFSQYYYEQGADELFFQDAVASLYDRNSLHEIVRLTASNIFIPLCVGGGLRSVEDVREVLRAGADKVAINTAAIKNPELIGQVASAFGSSTVVVAIEAIKNANGTWEALIEYGRETTGVDAVQWAAQAAELGAGELMVTSVNREGTCCGYDMELTRAISSKVSIPVIAAGGFGKPEHAVEVLRDGLADAVSIAASLHYGAIDSLKENLRSQDYGAEGNVEFLNTNRCFSTVKPSSVKDVKQALGENGFPCRL